MRRALAKLFGLLDKYDEVSKTAEEATKVGAFLVDTAKAKDVITAVGMISEHFDRYPHLVEPCPRCGAEPGETCELGCEDGSVE